MEEKTEAIVLKSIPFQEKDRILTLFSREMGLFSLIVKKISSPQLMTLTTPFCLGEFLYKKGRGELFSFRDGTVLDSHSFLRTDLASCMAAASMARALLNSHFPQGHISSLYLLFVSYLKQLPSFEKKENLVCSFCMKILLHEGVVHFSPLCNVCKEKTSTYLFRGESLCETHQEKGSIAVCASEWKTLETLTYCRSFQLLKECRITEELQAKIASFFQELCSATTPLR